MVPVLQTEIIAENSVLHLISVDVVSRTFLAMAIRARSSTIMFCCSATKLENTVLHLISVDVVSRTFVAMAIPAVIMFCN